MLTRRVWEVYETRGEPRMTAHRKLMVVLGLILLFILSSSCGENESLPSPNPNITLSPGLYYQNLQTKEWTRLATEASEVLIGDLNADGRDDIVGAWPSEGGLYLFDLVADEWTKLSSVGDSLAVCDMTGDGRDDLVGSWGEQGIIYRDSADGTWSGSLGQSTDVCGYGSGRAGRPCCGLESGALFLSVHHKNVDEAIIGTTG